MEWVVQQLGDDKGTEVKENGDWKIQKEEVVQRGRLVVGGATVTKAREAGSWELSS